ncbi:MAG: sulfurtransferase [Candidatus Dormibacteraceae bacterium]
MDTFGPVQSADWLRDHVNDADLRIVDLRWYLDGRSGRDAYLSGHLPGAAFADLEGEMTGKAPGLGRHPLPEREAFERAMRRLGIDASSHVVVYDDQGGMVAGRLWWLLRYFGHDAVALLDGGLQAWRRPLETGAATPEIGDFVAAPPQEGRMVDYEEVRRLAPGTVLLDARSGARFRGEEEPVEPLAGHIPGARSAPFSENLKPDGRFQDPEDLRRRYAALGVESGPETVVYCGSGVSACNDLIALELAGLGGARLYPGSWSDWSRREGAEVETGTGRS